MAWETRWPGKKRQGWTLGTWSEHEWCQQLVRDLVHTKNFESRARALTVQLFAGTVPAGAWRQAHGGADGRQAWARGKGHAEQQSGRMDAVQGQGGLSHPRCVLTNICGHCWI